MLSVLPVRAWVPAGMASRASQARRGELLRLLLADIEAILSRRIDAESIGAFFPTCALVLGFDAPWMIARIDEIRRGHGCSQGTYDRLLQLLWRFPTGAWRPVIQMPPASVAVMAAPDGRFVRLKDMAVIAFPPKSKKEAA